MPRGVLTCPVLSISGGADRNVSARISRSIARRYAAEHHIHPDRGHWMIADSVAKEIVPSVIEWLHRTAVASTTHNHTKV
ncbi:hypothetical protein [Actinomycetospora sp. NBC_00405]|uniref:hypothetical protein n=1 Tax=Actinomycetospora sp. NBC_00405 TaxID=2975952 RepID=UPI002E1E3157